MIGREREQAALARFVDAHDGPGGVVVLQGPAGIGKSSLLVAVRDHVAGRVLTTSGVQSEVALPFAALERLLRPLLPQVQRLPGPQREALLSGLGLADTAVPDHFLIGLAALNLLTGDGRVVALVDDAQWLDAASADVLAFVARRIEFEPVTMIVAQREGGPFSGLGTEIALGPLDDASARALLGAELPAATQRRLLAVAGGNPLALVELPKSAAAFSGPLVPLTERLERSFTAQQADLPETTRTLLLVAAADDRADVPELLAASRAGEADLEAAIDARLLERAGGFRHPLIRSAIYQAATVPQRRAAHAAIADVVSGHRRAWHRAAAASGPDEEIATALEAAAAEARRRGAIAAAARALQRAAELSADRDRAQARLLTAAELSAELGDVDIVKALIAQVDAPGAQARIRWLRETFAGDATDDVTPVRALLADARDADEDLAYKLLLAAGTRCWWAVDADHPVREEVVAATPRNDDPRAIAVLAAASAVRNAPDIIERLERVETEDPMGMHLLGQAAHMVGASAIAVRRLARVEAHWRAQGRLALLAQALVMRAWSTVQFGGWPAVEPAAAEARRLARETGQPLWEIGATAALAAAAGARGAYEPAMALAAEAEANLIGGRAANLSAVLQVARGVAALGAGRHAEAYDQLARTFDPHDPAFHYAECGGGLGYLAEAAVHCGRVDAARAVLERFEPAEGVSPLIAFGVAVARPLLADDEASFTAALAEGLPPFHRARVLLAYGAWLRRQRRAADSRAPLRTASDLFDALGTVPWAERARQELRASGERSTRRAAETLDQLTPQERQITELAASGLSNPEIGERLFLSSRTVASHLYRAFPKLGVSARTELADALRNAS